MSPATEAVDTVLAIHDAMQRMVEDDGLPADVLSASSAGFIAALNAIGFDVTPLTEPDPTDPETHEEGAPA